MPNFRLQIPNAHFHKHWHDSAAHKGRIVTWHNQAARKHRRRENRLTKAIKNFPRPVNGMVRPVVHCQTIRYNMKKRAGKGFTLEELKEAKVNRKEARTIGISVDFRRKNRSEESLRENVARLSEYKANLIVFRKKSNRKKPAAGDCSKDAWAAKEQVVGDVMPIVKPKPTIVPYKITQVGPCSLSTTPTMLLVASCTAPAGSFMYGTRSSRAGAASLWFKCTLTLLSCSVVQEDKDRKVFYTLRVCQSDAKMVGKREAAKKKAEAAEAEKKKASV
jgi:large subunit ribosomal protein L13e